jgi:PKD repeat protein
MFRTSLVPTANFSGTPLTGQKPLVVQFTGLSSGSPTSWSWEKKEEPSGDWMAFDGQPDNQNPEESFASEGETGEFSVRMTATNAHGSDTETKVSYLTITV